MPGWSVSFVQLGDVNRELISTEPRRRRQRQYQKTVLIKWAKQQRCTCITLFTFLWRPLLHHYDVLKPPNSIFYEGREHTTTNFPFSFWTRINSVFKNTTWSNRRDMVWKDTNSIFWRCFHCCPRHRRYLSSLMCCYSQQVHGEMFFLQAGEK